MGLTKQSDFTVGLGDMLDLIGRVLAAAHDFDVSSGDLVLDLCEICLIRAESVIPVPQPSPATQPSPPPASQKRSSRASGRVLRLVLVVLPAHHLVAGSAQPFREGLLRPSAPLSERAYASANGCDWAVSHVT